MASLNDNLFTTLLKYSTLQEFCCYIQTQWGPLKLSFTDQGLRALEFNDDAQSETDDDSVFRTAFLNWLRMFQGLGPQEQWNYLAPSGTDFQKQVWRALLDIPFGRRATYQDIAKGIGQENASRAVGSAIAKNPLALLIPCHRIVPSSGGTGNYRWGPDRKIALLDAENVVSSDLYQLFL